MTAPMDDGPALEELFAHLSVTADWTMGFLTALATGSDVVASDDWLPKVLPEAASDDPTTRKRCELLVRLYGAAAETLAHRAEIIPPENDKPAEDVVEFCRGYLSGAAMHASWQSDAGALEKLAPVTALASGNDADEEAHRKGLGPLVAQLRDHFKAKRQVINTSKVGRNDPCPCGSGKKSKKCCAA